MIITAQDKDAPDWKVIDFENGQPIGLVVKVNTETGVLKRYHRDSSGNFMRNWWGGLKIITERRNFKLMNSRTGQTFGSIKMYMRKK